MNNQKRINDEGNIMNVLSLFNGKLNPKTYYEY